MVEGSRRTERALRVSERTRLRASGLPPGAVSNIRSIGLTEGWVLCRTEPGAASEPDALPTDTQWSTATVPGTVASSIASSGERTLECDYDAYDWWFRCRVPAPEEPDADRVRLCLDGLATLAEVFWNGRRVLTSTNMFLAHEVEVTDILEPANELSIVFRSLTEELVRRRPRPRWKTKLVEHQQLRWFRTSLLGRIPGWTPPMPPVGPWRPVRLEVCRKVDVRAVELRSRVEGDAGLVDFRCRVEDLSDTLVLGATLKVGDEGTPLEVARDDVGWALAGTAHVERPALWWPRTHGEPALYACSVTIETTGDPVTIDCGKVGFRTVEVDLGGGGIRFVVNGVPVFCRGACWTTNDPASLTGSLDDLRDTLRLAAGANANMIRVGGTMVYEADEFYRECDRLGLMVWQDFMFANMDYPVEDADFDASIRAEAIQQLARFSHHPSVVAYCGGSEVEQQAAMFGAPRDAWTNAFFSSSLPQLIRERGGDLPYWPSSPTEGVLPFHVATGLSHYYGVGAYRRTVDDARLAGVRFTPECLGFANLPEPANLRRIEGGGSLTPTDPAWKAGVPRDGGASWDFDDVRDHYLELLYGQDAAKLRAENPDQYLRLSRTVTGRVMARVFDEWRSPASGCGGGLVWFLRDLRPGAGWGIVDSDNRPKPVYFHLKRAWAPRRVALLDRGLDGIVVQLHNETPTPWRGLLRLRTHGVQSETLADASIEISVPPRGSLHTALEQVLDRFTDPTYSYRFGPPAHAAISAVIEDMDGAGSPHVEVYWPSLPNPLPPVRLEGMVDSTGVVLSADALARDVRLEVSGWDPDDNYFDLLPGEQRAVAIPEGNPQERPRRGFVEAENLPVATRLTTQG